MAIPAMHRIHTASGARKELPTVHRLLLIAAQRSQTELAVESVERRDRHVLHQEPLHVPGLDVPDGHLAPLQREDRVHGQGHRRLDPDQDGHARSGSRLAPQDQTSRQRRRRDR